MLAALSKAIEDKSFVRIYLEEPTATVNIYYGFVSELNLEDDYVEIWYLFIKANFNLQNHEDLFFVNPEKYKLPEGKEPNIDFLFKKSVFRPDLIYKIDYDILEILTPDVFDHVNLLGQKVYGNEFSIEPSIITRKKS